MQVINYLRDALDGQLMFQRIVNRERGVRLDLRMVDFGAGEDLFPHEVGFFQALAPVAELVMHLAFKVSGFVVVYEGGAGRAGVLRGVVGGQFADFKFDQRQRLFRGLGVDGCDRRHRIAAIADAAARQRILVHRDRQNAVGMRAVVAGDDADHALQGERLGDVEPYDFSVADRAAENPADKRIAVIEVSGILGASRDLLDAVDQRDTAPAGKVEILRIHGVVPAAILTDSIIFM
ncbi:MAG: hypothetical protein GHHEDOFH_02504 [Pseudorhodoplanes sp.]|nr:hypothetical protein [Pseudorhodoplanes sp.]